MDTKKYVIMSADSLSILQNEVNKYGLPYSLDALKTSLNGEKFIYEYEGDQPDWIFLFVTKDLIGLPEHTAEEMAEILATPEWTPNIYGIT